MTGIYTSRASPQMGLEHASTDPLSDLILRLHLFMDFTKFSISYLPFLTSYKASGAYQG